MYILPVLCRTFEKVHALHSQETKLSEKMNLLMTEWVTTGAGARDEIASRNATMAVCRVGWVAGVAGCQKSICTQQKVDIWFSDNCPIFVIFSYLYLSKLHGEGGEKWANVLEVTSRALNTFFIIPPTALSTVHPWHYTGKLSLFDKSFTPADFTNFMILHKKECNLRHFKARMLIFLHFYT